MTANNESSVWRFFFPQRDRETETGFREHYLSDDVRQVVAILSFVIVFMAALTLVDVVNSDGELPAGFAIRSSFMLIGAVIIWLVYSVGRPWAIDLAAAVYTTVVAAGVFYFHTQGGASVERVIAIITLLVYVAHISFPTYTVYLAPSLILVLAGESYMLSRTDSAIYTADATIIMLAMFASLGFAALGSALRQRSRFNAYRALTQVKTLSGLIPICASCKKVRNDDGFYMQVEQYIRTHSDAEFSHGLCPECGADALKEAIRS